MPPYPYDYFTDDSQTILILYYKCPDNSRIISKNFFKKQKINQKPKGGKQCLNWGYYKKAKALDDLDKIKPCPCLYGIGGVVRVITLM
jgi:hypothetical protein